jgi:hypothetical protein
VENTTKISNTILDFTCKQTGTSLPSSVTSAVVSELDRFGKVIYNVTFPGPFDVSANNSFVFTSPPQILAKTLSVQFTGSNGSSNNISITFTNNCTAYPVILREPNIPILGWVQIVSLYFYLKMKHHLMEIFWFLPIESFNLIFLFSIFLFFSSILD